MRGEGRDAASVAALLLECSLTGHAVLLPPPLLLLFPLPSLRPAPGAHSKIPPAALCHNLACIPFPPAAMVLHKAPMAFGLATYLMACRWNFARSRGTLLAFAAAAPAATLATYALLGSLAVLQHPAAVALCVIFSGGTFLYAATMHILPEVLGDSGHMSSAQLAAVVVGSLLPVALSWGHHH